MATLVTVSPAPSRGNAATRHACCRHSTKLNPVSCRNIRVKFRRLIRNLAHQPSIASCARGARKKAWHSFETSARRGNGNAKGKIGNCRISCSIRLISAPARPAKSYSSGMANASPIRLRMNGDIPTTWQNSGKPLAAAGSI